MPARSHACCVDSISTLTAMLNVVWPSMISSRSVWLAMIVSPMLPSEASRIGPIAPSPSGPSTTAPAPSPNSEAVRLSSGSVMRESDLGADHEHALARGRSRSGRRRPTARTSQPVQAAPTS